MDHGMETYEIEITSSAAQAIIKLPRREQPRVARRIDSLADEPRPHNVEKLSGIRNAYRIRVGDYRIVYTVDDTIRVVSVKRVGHRREVYRRL